MFYLCLLPFVLEIWPPKCELRGGFYPTIILPSTADGEEARQEGSLSPQLAAEFPVAAPPEVLSELQLGSDLF